MFSYAVKHPKRPANIEDSNHQKLSPLTLASKLGRFQLFNEIIQLQSQVSWQRRTVFTTIFIRLYLSRSRVVKKLPKMYVEVK